MNKFVLDLDWRDTTGSQWAIWHLIDLLEHICKQGSADMILSGYLTGKNGAALRYVDGRKIVNEEDATPGMPRLFVCERPKEICKKAENYLCQLSVVASQILRIQDKRVATAQRLYGYYWTSKLLSRDVARSLTIDLALTTGIHPFALGILPEARGRYGICTGYNIEFTLCEDIFKYGDNTIHNVRKRHQSGPIIDVMIPTNIVSLEISPQKKRNPEPIRAVIVLEHKNVQHILGALMKSENEYFQYIWFVMTGGFADLATREFLHLLAKDPMMKHAEFLFISDRDPHAVEIFSNLKYGSRQAAYMSLSSSCPRLKWGGISIERYLKLQDQWPAKSVDIWLKQQTSPPTQQVKDNMLSEAKRKTKAAMIDGLSKASSQLNASDKNRLRHFHKYRNFGPDHEPELYKDLLAMGMNDLDAEEAIREDAKGQKFGLAQLAKLNCMGIEEAIVDVMISHNIIAAPNTIQAGTGAAQVRALWNAAGMNFVATPVVQVTNAVVDQAASSSAVVVSRSNDSQEFRRFAARADS